jgi:methylase of polypeptide subunit release factors
MTGPAELSPADLALLRLLEALDARGYDFVTPTPLTHQRVLARRPGATARDLRAALGWSLPFRREALPDEITSLLERAGVLAEDSGLLKSEVRVSRVRGLLFLHSAFPTESANAVFLGPDSYRFADFIAAELVGRSWVGSLAEVGAGAGVGALTAAAGRGRRRVFLSDVNPDALRLAQVNAAYARIPIETVQARDLDGLPAALDVIVANPPYIAGSPAQTYKNGGDLLGARVSLEWATAALDKLAPAGRLLLYTGSAVLNGGRDQLRERLVELADRTGVRLAYRELDPDVFGEELDTQAYADAERIAVVGAVLVKPRG